VIAKAFPVTKIRAGSRCDRKGEHAAARSSGAGGDVLRDSLSGTTLANIPNATDPGGGTNSWRWPDLITGISFTIARVCGWLVRCLDDATQVRAKALALLRHATTPEAIAEPVASRSRRQPQ
jgi:hypothetical protein